MLKAGDIIEGRYVIRSLAGSGGMGRVYRAHDTHTDDQVAVKMLEGQGPGDPIRFAREVEILAEARDPGVVRYRGHGQSPTGTACLIMDWLDGYDLKALLQLRRLGVAEAVGIVKSVANTLGRLHERGIVHRDLKPGNVFLVGGDSQAVMLLDFGLAQHDDAVRLTKTGTLIGTASYMSPEQARGAKIVDARADVFALGCLLMECLTGQQAFAGTHVLAILAKILFEESPRLSQLCKKVPKALDELVPRLLARDPEQRLAHGHAVAQALEQLGPLPTDALEDIVHDVHTTVLTTSEQRAVAILFLGVPDAAEESGTNMKLMAEAVNYNGTYTSMVDGSAAVLLTGTAVATDLATQAARCALSMRRHTTHRKIALSMGRSDLSGRASMAATIDRAVRILSATTGPISTDTSQITLDDATVGLLDARFDIQESSGIFVLHGERDVVEVRTLLGKHTPCVGRDRELRTLEGLFEDCLQEREPQAALVTAPPGVGKSRLAREFIRTVRHRSDDVDIWVARGEALRSNSVFGMLAQLVRSAVHTIEADSVEARQNAILQAVNAWCLGKDRTRIASFLAEIIGAPFPDDDNMMLRAARHDAPLMHDQVRDAFIDFIAARSERVPVVLLLEDLHWADAATVRILDRAMHQIEDKPLFVFALARPDVHETFEKLWKGCSVQEIRLNELPKKAAERLVRYALGPDIAQAAVERIVHLADGNSLFLEELIRSTAEHGNAELPNTLVAMIHARLGALDDESRRLLRASSIFGEVFWSGAAASLIGAKPDEKAQIEARLDYLAEKEILQAHRSSRFSNEREYAFRHALLREGAAAMLTDADRTLGHRLAASWLDAHGEQDAGVIAEHFEQGQDLANAGKFWLQAARRTLWSNDTKKTLAQLERGIACPVAEDIRHDLLGMFCETIMWRMEEPHRALAHAEELYAHAKRGGAPWTRALIVRLMFSGLTGNAAVFGQCSTDLLTTSFTPEASEPATVAFGAVVMLLDFAGQIPHGSGVFTPFEAFAKQATHFAPTSIGILRMISGFRISYALHDPWSALEQARLGLREMIAIAYSRNMLACKTLCGMNTWALGDLQEAKRLCLEAASDDEYGMGSTCRPFTLAWVLADLGEFEEARHWALRLAEGGKTRQSPLDESRGRWVLAEVLRRAGDHEGADAAAHVALAMSVPLDQPGVRATVAALRLSQGRVDEALAMAEDAATRMDTIGTVGFFRNAFVRLVHAECLEAAGQRDKAKNVVQGTVTYLQSVAERIADPALRASFLQQSPENKKIFDLAQRWA